MRVIEYTIDDQKGAKEVAERCVEWGLWFALQPLMAGKYLIQILPRTQDCFEAEMRKWNMALWEKLSQGRGEELE